MSSLWNPTSEPDPPPAATPTEVDITDTGVDNVEVPQTPIAPAAPAPPARPQVRREQSAPPPNHEPPAPPAPQQVGNPTDSLSLMQLRRIVTELPRVEPVAYAFTYADTASYEEEIDEWFSYHEAEATRLKWARDSFGRRWKKYSSAGSWLDADREKRKAFVQRQIPGLQSSDGKKRCKSLQTLLHIVLGVWDETAGDFSTPLNSANEHQEPAMVRSVATKSQVDAMKIGVQLLTECDGISRVYNAMRAAFDRIWGNSYEESQITKEEMPLMQDELDNTTTIMYILIETARNNREELASTCEELGNLKPGLLHYLLSVVSKLRWDEANELPQTRIFLLFWKSILLTFGSSDDLHEVKLATNEKLPSDNAADDIITASPLDYHLFRQEITSKYPAYVPPAPILPFELETNSILPPLPNHPTRNNGSNGILPTPAGANSGGASILHQPVHITTPAPSPPPSPAIGGKAGKKQNYQTNQNFPFMYPPLDSTSNGAGGKGIAGLQEQMVGRKWEGSDIPASILEAGQLFANRTRMTRAMRQLWDERERFLKYERGWDATEKENDDTVEMDLEMILAEKLSLEEKVPAKPEMDYGPRPVDDIVKERLDVVESFYRTSIPHLQSLVIVLLKAILANVTALIMQPPHPGHPGLGPSFQSEVNLRNGGQGARNPQNNGNPPQQSQFDATDLSIDDLEALRSREITAKAVSGILLTLLKWFKVSHVLKFEYLTQLLLDSNYLPLVLKLFAHSEIDKVVDSDSNRKDLSFFNFCNTNSKKQEQVSDLIESEEDDAAPPPIKLNRPLASSLDPDYSQNSDDPLSAIPPNGFPQTDELGYPLTDIPITPKTTFSFRNFFSSINLLRIMQKICKGKAHRNLLLVQYKSSNILKKALKIPQHELRLYTLKLFKNQVPYCGRKWRQGNMRVITAVYLHCRPELRDEWLAGSDVDAEVEEALPLEQAVRSLTHWWNARRYPEMMGVEGVLLQGEGDFFVRELERMEGGCNGGIGAEEEGDEGSNWGNDVGGW